MAGTETSSAGNGGPQLDDAKAQAQEKAQEAKAKASDQVRTQVDQRSTQAGEQLGKQVSDIKAVGDQLREQGKDGPAKVADQVAERGERLSAYLTDSDSDRILRDLEDLGRKQPLAVVAGGIALGFAASRFLKASSRQRSSTSAPTPSPINAPDNAPRRDNPALAPALPTGVTPTASPVGVV